MAKKKAAKKSIRKKSGAKGKKMTAPKRRIKNGDGPQGVRKASGNGDGPQG
jgi:hypothetical protein